jgi:hypothetical protein
MQYEAKKESRPIYRSGVLVYAPFANRLFFIDAATPKT